MSQYYLKRLLILNVEYGAVFSVFLPHLQCFGRIREFKFKGASGSTGCLKQGQLQSYFRFCWTEYLQSCG